jgi:putative transposase
MSARGCTRFPPHIGQSALRDLNAAFERFFKGWKGDAPKSGYPRFKKRGERDSARVYEVALEERHIRLPNIGRARMKEARSKRGFQGRILLATIRRRADRWFVLLCVMREREIIGPRPVKKLTDIVGVDLGVKTAAVIHDSAATRVIEPSQAFASAPEEAAAPEPSARAPAGKLTQPREGEARTRAAPLQDLLLRQDHLHQLSSHLAKPSR